MTIFGFVLATIFIPAWTGSAIPTGWVFLSCTLPMMLWGKVEISHGILFALGTSFLAYAALSLLWTPVPHQGVGDLWLLAILAAAFTYGASQTNSSKLYLGLACGVGVSTVLAIPQYFFDFNGIYQSWKPAGLFINPGVYGETCALVLVALVASRQYWPTILVAPGIYLSNSRTAVLAVAAAVLVAAWDKVAALGPDRPALWKNPYVLSTTAVLAILAVVALHSTLIREPNWWTSPNERLAIWRDTTNGLALLGHGAGSFLITYPLLAKRTDTMATRPEHAHSDVLELAYEFGLGAIPLAILAVLALRAPAIPERYIFIAFLLTATLSFPTRLPVTGFLGAFAFGRCVRSWAMVRSNSLLSRSTFSARQGDRVYG